MDSSLRVVAVIMLSLVIQRSNVAAQQNNVTLANACYSACEARYNARNSETSSRGVFLARYQNSTRNASDYYCRLTANISACFNNCMQTYPTVYYYKRYIIESLTTNTYNCFNDESKCRAQDSILWCTVYSSDSCDSNTTNVDKCIVNVQAQRGCSLNYPTSLSQRVVLATRLTDLLYCLYDVDFFTFDLNEGDMMQVCAQYLPEVCFSIVLSANGGASYVKENLTCRDVKEARDCVKSSYTQTIAYQSRQLVAPCSYHPYASTLFAKMDFVLNSFLPCLSTNTVSSTVDFTLMTTSTSISSSRSHFETTAGKTAAIQIAATTSKPAAGGFRLYFDLRDDCSSALHATDYTAGILVAASLAAALHSTIF